MCFLSRLFCNNCNNCNNNCRSSLFQNVRMRCVDAGGSDNCERQNTRSGFGCDCDCGCNSCSRRSDGCCD